MTAQRQIVEQLANLYKLYMGITSSNTTKKPAFLTVGEKIEISNKVKKVDLLPNLQWSGLV